MLLLALGALCSFVAARSLIHGVWAAEHQGGVAGGCGMSWMSPHYVRLDGLDRNHSRLADKYGLYLYREAGWDRQELDGVPVLFVPGNAGSFRQVRSLASSAARQYFNEPGQALGRFTPSHGSKQLDWYAVDFNEDFSAFHGTTLLEQAEYLNDAVIYILSLYQRSPQPTAVMAVAHSMGGIAARKMMTLGSFKAGSVSTLITLSTPHLLPPVTFDHQVEHVYEDINGVLRDSFSSGTASELGQLLMVSVSGGTSDTMISSDTTSLADLVPPTHGFTVFTTSIPGLYAPVDHQAVMWCDQLRSRIARALLETVDITQPTQVKHLEERNRILRQHLLPGLDEERVVIDAPGPVQLPAEIETRQWDGEAPLMLQGSEGKDILHLVAIAAGTKKTLIVLTDARPEDFDVMVRSSSSNEWSSVQSSRLVSIPRSSAGRTTRNDDPLQSYVRLDLPLVSIDVSAIGILVREGASFSYFATQLLDTVALDLVAGTSVFSTLKGVSLPLPNQLVASLQLPALDSALLVYSLSTQTRCLGSPFAPLLRVFSKRNFESHWYPAFQNASIYIHGAAPFIFTSQGQLSSLNLQLWRDPTCDEPLVLRLRVDILASLGQMVIRYRTAFAAWPFAFALIILVRQLGRWQKPNARLHTLSHAIRHAVPREAAVVAMRVLLFSFIHTLALKWLGPRNDWLSSAFFGNDWLLFAPVLPVVLLCVVGAFTVLVALVLQYAVLGIGRTTTFVLKRSPSGLKPQEDAYQPGKWQRLALIATLSATVWLFAPVQFAFLVLLLAHLCTTLRSLVLAYDAAPATARHAWHRFHYQMTMLLVMVTLLPLTGPILLVWSRNLLAGYYAPFSSDRNPLAIIGFILWTDAVHSNQALPSRAFALKLAVPLCTFAIYYMLAYGIRYSYSALPLANLIFACLAIAHWEQDRDESVTAKE